MDSEIEMNLPGQRMKVDESYIPFAPSQFTSNRHLYTCSKPIKTEPLMVSDSGLSLDQPFSESFPYAMKSVYDLSAKCSEDWVARRFMGLVSLLSRVENKFI